PSLGGSRSSSMISQSLPMSLSTAALVFMRPPAGISRHHPPAPPSRSISPAPKTATCTLASRTSRSPGPGPPPSAVGYQGRGAQLQLRAVVRGPVGQFGAVPGDDLPDPQRRRRAEQVVTRDEQLPGRSPRPRRRQQ